MNLNKIEQLKHNFAIAAVQGDQKAMAEAITELVCELPEYKWNEEKGLLLLAADSHNCLEAMKMLGSVYRDGAYNEPKDQSQALKWYRKAADGGHAEAQYILGEYSAGREGTLSKDMQNANNWYRDAAEQGHVKAQYRLGVNYANGKGVPKDLEKAKYWISLAAEKSYMKEAKKALAKLEKGATKLSGGCYVATSVYGSYDCPEVWTLRRYRDDTLSASWLGRRFIQAYYAVSPMVVALFGNQKWFTGLCRPMFDKLVRKLRNSGVDSGPYLGM